MTETAVAAVAHTAANGHPVDPLEHLPVVVERHGPDAKPAKIEEVARRWRGPIRRWRDRRAAKASAKATEQAGVVDNQADWERWLPALVWACLAVVAGTFVLSYHGLYEFGREIAYLPEPLPIIVPIGVDALSIVTLIATFLTRDAHWHVRAYCWLLFIGTVAISIAGNATYAVSGVDARLAALSGDGDGKWGYLEWGAIAGAALWPAFSAAALHLLIVTYRHLSARRAKVNTLAQQAARDEDAQQLQRARAIELIAAGLSCAAIAEQIAEPRRNVERWTAGIRGAITAAETAARGSATKPVTKSATTRRTPTA